VFSSPTRAYGNQAVEIYLTWKTPRHLGAYLPNIARAISNDADRREECGDLEGAKADMGMAAHIYRGLAALHPVKYRHEFAYAMQNFGRLTLELAEKEELDASYRQAGRTEDALTIEEEEKVAADRARILGPEHPDTILAQDKLAASYWYAGRTHDALLMQEKAVAGFVRTLGPENPNTLRSRATLATFYWYAGRPHDAVAIWEKAAAGFVRTLGPEPPDTRAVVETLRERKERLWAREEMLLERKETLRKRKDGGRRGSGRWPRRRTA
jgi:tetratricopeptide (TPR) repeat protein